MLSTLEFIPAKFWDSDSGARSRCSRFPCFLMPSISHRIRQMSVSGSISSYIMPSVHSLCRTEIKCTKLSTFHKQKPVFDLSFSSSMFVGATRSPLKFNQQNLFQYFWHRQELQESQCLSVCPCGTNLSRAVNLHLSKSDSTQRVT